MAAKPVAAKTAAPPPPVVEGANFGDLNFYSSGFTLPEGNYTCFFNVVMHEGFGTTKQAPKLGVMVDTRPIDDPNAEVKQIFLGVGGKAHESWAPNPNTGKGIVPIIGGKGQGLNVMSNWAIFLKSFYDCGLPAGVFTNDMTPLDGVGLHIHSVPEPEERKSFQSQTSEVQADRKDNKVYMVTEIIDGMKPWEGAVVAPAPTAAPKAGPVAVKPAAAKAPAAPVAEESDEESIHVAALGALELELTKSPTGAAWMKVKLDSFKTIEASSGKDMAAAVASMYYGSDDTINQILGELGYAKVGPMIKPLS